MARRVTEKQVPNRAFKEKALYDRCAFADLIGFHGGVKEFGELHMKINEFMYSGFSEDNTVVRELYLLPRGHLKTTWCTVLDVLHDIYINPNIRIYIGCANLSLSKAILREIKAYLEDAWLGDYVWNDRPHFEGRLIPLMDKGAKQRRDEFSGDDEPSLIDKKVVWRQDSIQVLRSDKLKEPTVTTGCVESPSTGFHYDKIYFDDIINFENYNKPDKIERLDIWRSDMFSVIDPEYFDDELYERLTTVVKYRKAWKFFKMKCHVGNFVRVVGTRYFKHDWYAALQDDADYIKFQKNIYVNGETNTDGYIWHEKWSEKEELRRRRSMTKKHFYAQYLNKIIVDTDIILPFDRVQFIRPQDVLLKKGAPKVYVPDLQPKEGEPVGKVEVLLHCAIDPAATCTPDSDYTAIAVGGKDPYGNLYIFDLKLLKLTSTRWIKELFKLLDKWNNPVTHLEVVAFSAELKTTIRNEARKNNRMVSLREYKPSTRTSKKERIETGLEPLLDNNALFLSTYLASFETLVDQFNFFPSETVKDDGLDAMQILNECAKVTIPNVVNLNNYRQQQIHPIWGGYIR